jgi:hypothetical protein
MIHRRSPRLERLAPAFLLVPALILPVAVRTACANPDPLARPEFHRELSVGMERIDIVAVFRAIAGITGVTFILDFERDPTLKVTLKATNMVCRGILESLASTYGLEYSWSDAGVVVRRRGIASTTGAITVGPPPRPSGPVYWFDLVARDAQGRAQRFLRVERYLGVFEPLIFYVTGHPDVTTPVLNQRRGTIDQRSLGAFELTLGVKSDTGSNVELVAELVTRRRIDDRRFTEMHAVNRTLATPGELLLFGRDDGYELVVTDWGRTTPGTAAAQR